MSYQCANGKHPIQITSFGGCKQVNELHLGGRIEYCPVGRNSPLNCIL